MAFYLFISCSYYVLLCVSVSSSLHLLCHVRCVMKHGSKLQFTQRRFVGLI